MEKKQSIRKWAKKLKNKYRLLLINETNFKERLSVSLTIGNVLILFASGLLIFSLIFWGIFTIFPTVKDYTPGYGNTVDGKFKNKIINSMKKIEEELLISEKKNKALLQIINGEEVTAYDIPYKADKSRKVEIEINETKADGNRVADADKKIDNAKEKEIKETKTFIEQKENSMLGKNQEDNFLDYNVLFFKPIEGKVVTTYSSSSPYLLIQPSSEESVKSVQSGIVVFSGWTPENGYVVSVQHSNNLISIYKNLLVVYKKTGQNVESGSPLGSTGNTQNKISSKGLHLELWQNGNSINPENYIIF